MENIKYFIASFCLLFMAGCSNSFIERVPISNANLDDLYQDDIDFRNALIAIYDVFQSQYNSNMWIIGDMPGEDVHDELVKDPSAAFDNFVVNDDNNNLLTSWRNYYRIIHYSNTLIDRVNESELEESDKKKFEGEGRFLRGLAYFDLVRIFGDIPYINEVVEPEDALKEPRTDMNIVYDGIVNDFLFASQYLPLTYGGDDVGRATAGAAKALLGKVYLTIHDFEKAESVLSEVTEMGYELLEDYNELFNYTKDEHHSEYIFDIEYEAGMNEGSSFTTNFCPKDPATSSYYGVTGGQNGNNNPVRAYFDLFPEGDLRKAVTVADGFFDDDGVWHPLIPTSNDVQTYTKKYMVAIDKSGDSPANWKIIRYGDVLLMLSESLMENGKLEEAIIYLNKIRIRAGLDPYEEITSQSDLREKIYLERRLELGFEGHRWFDLVRTGLAYDVCKDLGMKEYMTVFPIPVVEIDIVNDESILYQNDGY